MSRTRIAACAVPVPAPAALLPLAALLTAALLIMPGGAMGQEGDGHENTAQHGGFRMAQTETTTISFVAAADGDVLASDLIGMDVRNSANEEIGEVEDLIIGDGRTIRAVIISVGGFLGLGERYVAVDPASIMLVRDGDDDWDALLEASAAEFENAPEFTYREADWD